MYVGFYKSTTNGRQLGIVSILPIKCAVGLCINKRDITLTILFFEKVVQLTNVIDLQGQIRFTILQLDFVSDLEAIRVLSGCGGDTRHFPSIENVRCHAVTTVRRDRL